MSLRFYEIPNATYSFHIIQCNKCVTRPFLATHDAVMNVFAIVAFTLGRTANKALISWFRL